MSNKNRYKTTSKSPNRATTADPHRLLREARQAIAAGQTALAERLCGDALKACPANADGHCLLAELYSMTGRTDQAIYQLQRATLAAPGSALPHLSLGILYLNHGNAESARSCLQSAVALDPGLAEAYALLGTAHRRTAQLQEAVDAYSRALALKPDHVETHYNLGVTLSDLGRYHDAIAQYHTLLALQPDHADAYHGLGLCMDWLGDLQQSASYYEQGLRLAPTHIGIQNNIGSVYLAQQRLGDALEAYRKSADLKHDHGRPVKGPLHMILHRIRHDAEQLRYLDEKGLLPGVCKDYLLALSELEAKHAGRPGTERVTVDALTAQRIAPTFNRIIHRAESPEIPGGALNPEIDWTACEAAYLHSTPEVVTIDNFLRPEALSALRNYCLESTVWKTVRPYGYLGALITEGLATPLLLQIITELRQRMPGILSAHNLAQAWAYKYDSSLRAINIHADCAAVNINFWITPDTANRNPDNGGLVLWDKAPPPDWGLMRTQNPDKTEIIRYLETSGAKTITVPHRQNRMVLFNSALFHKSDDMEFRDGYENRRINVTLLYGNGLR